MKTISTAYEFAWDKGNIGKNQKHNVEDQEAEEPFGDEEKYILRDEKHSNEVEERYLLLGKTKSDRKLSIIFTFRGNKIRIISARDMNKKERRRYEKKV